MGAATKDCQSATALHVGSFTTHATQVEDF